MTINTGTERGRPPRDEEQLVLVAREVEFDWSDLPWHWIPGDPVTTHTFNVMHLLLPAGEDWFVQVLREALPMIRDDRVREDVLGFIGQEAMHSQAHGGVLEHFTAAGVDVTDYTRQVDWAFRILLGGRDLRGRRAENWLVERVALIAAIEHYTAVLGDWVLDSPALDRAGADPTMLDLLRWHGAEEVEHRAVCFDLLTHLDDSYIRRVRTYLLVTPALFWLWVRGVRFLMAVDPEVDRKARWQDWTSAARRGLLPSPAVLVREIVPYLRRKYHPSAQGSVEPAIRYLATSPAARAGH
ncbi:metal-dependent hydrolase [Dietzia sp. SLG310A2-38A2]|uniref:metal-dependent hydrolase n=1 Tax=Dietzia sp. SLG310A2-38A2 TaxID=1630643 RepID=UPI0015F9170C|nr:metal-dependent hydrolase [Dietzia sp. SLG310A2-38A2]MBB1029415.1 metal-dependent hydrolase [Dietzia sp. SLG310A2-38A2]